MLLVKHGADDTLGRPIFERVAKQIGQSLVFEHRPGTGGALGMAQIAKPRKPDLSRYEANLENVRLGLTRQCPEQEAVNERSAIWIGYDTGS